MRRRPQLAHALARDKPIREKGRFGYTGTPVTDADWLYGRAVLFVPVENVRIGDIRSAVDRRQSTDAAPVTESLALYTFLRLYDNCAAGYTLSWTFCDTVLENLRAPEQWLRCGILPVYRTMEGATLVDDRVGVTFDVELCVPWDAPEAVVDINSADVVTLGSVPDKVGLVGRRKDAAPSRILQGRDSQSVRFLVPDVRGVDQNFHDVAIVDMDDEREPKVMLADLCHLRDSWPPGILNHMKWSQQNFELMREEAKREFTQSRPMPCKYCRKVINYNIYRHMARLHLDLTQLWRCPVSWCTMWRGTPQDCMEHLRNGHDVPLISKTASIERFVPPWTVRRELWTESLRQEHSGISTNIMLFSDLSLSLTHHYRVYRGGLPHAAFRGDYMTRFRALLPTPPSMNGEPTSSPEAVQGATPRSKRRVHRPFRPVCVMSAALGELPVLTLQDPADVVGASVIDCRPPVLPVSIPLMALSPTTIENARGASAFNPSRTEGQSIMDTNEITIDRIVGFPWNDPGTDLEDEQPTPASSPVQCTTLAVMTGEAEGPQEFNDNFDLDLAKVLLDVSVMPTMVPPIVEVTEIADYAAPEVLTTETIMETPGLALPQVTSWIPRYSPISTTASMGGEDRPMSTVQSSSYLPMVAAAPPTGCPETLDEFLPIVTSPLVEPSESPGREYTIKKAETEIFVVEGSGESPPVVGRQADQFGRTSTSRSSTSVVLQFMHVM